MKTHLFKQFTIIFLLSVSGFLAFTTPTRADSPVIAEEIWEGHVWKPAPFDSKTFSAPAGATSVEVLGEWGWSGHPGQNQQNEKHQFQFPNGQVIECNDYGDEELDGQWIRCGSVAFAQEDDLKIKVQFTGDNSSPGSHYFRAIVRWYGKPTVTPPSGEAGCTGGSVTNPNSFPIQVTYKVDDTIVFEGQVAANSTQPINYTYHDLVSHTAGFTWSGNGQSGHVTLDSFGPCDPTPRGTASCTGGSVTNANPFPILVTYKVDDTIVFQGEVAANSTQTVNYTYNDAISHTAEFAWSGNGSRERVNLDSFGPCQIVEAASCTLTALEQDRYAPGAVDEAGSPVAIDDWMAESNFDLSYPYELTSLSDLPVTVNFPDEPGKKYWVQFKVLVEHQWLGGKACRLEYEKPDMPCPGCGQYQDFVGAVPFGTYTPYLEPGKEYFDGARSLMFNIEYLTDAGQGDVVFRFNGQETSDVTTSIFHAGSFRQIESANGRAVTTFDEGTTKLIAYRYGVEQARIFQTMSLTGMRWIHPLDQPFEHKYDFELEIRGPANVTDLLVYADKQLEVTYDENGIAAISLTYAEPGLVAIYPKSNSTAEVEWITVDTVTFPITSSQTVNYNFSEMGLYHYRLVDNSGQVIVGPQASSHLEFRAAPELTYQAQLAYPATSLFVGLYDDMKFNHPDYWTMPVDARLEHDFEFHLDYHRLNDPDLNNDHRRGDVVVDALYLTNGTTSVAQQFPYGRHDGSTPGVKIVGIPNVSLVAFCQRPGVHEVVYWGGWENESYYLPERGWIFDQERYNEWNDDQRGDCLDAAHRVNMLLAREGLRTDHTYRHHGQRSQGYQMTQRHIWSPYNLVGMRPPHLGQLLKPGMVLPYYEAPEDLLFWGWDLDKEGLAEGIGAFELQQHVAALGPVVYGDQTGIHPPEKWYVPEPPTFQLTPQLPVPQPTLEPPLSEPMPEAPTSEPTLVPPMPEPLPQPPAPEPTPVPPVLEPLPAPIPTT